MSYPFLFPVGEPLNHEAWEWYYNLVGEKRCPIADTWWQTGMYCAHLGFSDYMVDSHNNF